MTRPGSDSDLTETMLYNLNSGPDTLAALVKTLDFLSEAVCAMASSNAISLDYSADGLHYLLQHLGSLIKRASDECEEEMSLAFNDKKRLYLLEQLQTLYTQHNSLTPPDVIDNDENGDELLQQIQSLEKQLAEMPGSTTLPRHQTSITDKTTQNTEYRLFNTTYSLTCQPVDYGIY